MNNKIKISFLYCLFYFIEKGVVPSRNFNTNLESTSPFGTFNSSSSDHFGIQSYQPGIDELEMNCI